MTHRPRRRPTGANASWIACRELMLGSAPATQQHHIHRSITHALWRVSTADASSRSTCDSSPLAQEHHTQHRSITRVFLQHLRQQPSGGRDRRRRANRR